MSKFRENEGARHSKLSVREEIISVLSKEQKRGLSWTLLNYRRTSSALGSRTNRKRCSQERCLQTEHAPHCEEGSQRSQSRPEARPVRAAGAGQGRSALAERTRGLCGPAMRSARRGARALTALPPVPHRRCRQRRPLPCSSHGERASEAEATQHSKNNGHDTKVLFLSTFLAVAQGKTRSYCQNPNWFCSRVQI